MSSFRLAPMTTDLLIITILVLAMPVFLLLGGLRTPPPLSTILNGSFTFVVLIYMSVWFWWRPSRFEVGPDGLTIQWPLRRLAVENADIRDVSIVGRKDFRRAYGWGMRVGAGGLWGGFGLLVTSKETFSMYISRTDAFVLVRRASGRTLMLTPEEPERFVAALRAPYGGR